MCEFDGGGDHLALQNVFEVYVLGVGLESGVEGTVSQDARPGDVGVLYRHFSE